MRTFIHGIALIAAWFLFHGQSAAIDYSATWEFQHPLGNQPPLPFPVAKGSLVYNQDTGSLIYCVGADGSWLPPDIGSLSGLLDVDEPLPSVPLWGIPTFQSDETFAGSLVAGSNAVRINFDSYSFWPWTAESPRILESYGLSEPPRAYNYGEILPAGLAREDLELDLYAVSFPARPYDLVLVPEPGAATSLVTAGIIAGALRRWRNKRRSPR